MTTRMAILIEASKVKNHDDLPGAREDVDSYRAYLKSDFGGAWNDDEISVVSHPTKDTLDRYLRLARLADYAFVTFSGHGYHAVGKNISETRLLINDTEEVTATGLYSGNPRSLIIPDACRIKTLVTMEKSARSIAMALNQAEVRLKPNRQRCRALFDASVAKGDEGPIYMYSCDVNETAGDINSFSRILVGVGETWADRRAEGVLLTREAFSAAAAATTSKNPRQNPKMDAGRRINHFPFSVFAY